MCHKHRHKTLSICACYPCIQPPQRKCVYVCSVSRKPSLSVTIATFSLRAHTHTHSHAPCRFAQSLKLGRLKGAWECAVQLRSNEVWGQLGSAALELLDVDMATAGVCHKRIVYMVFGVV